MQISFPWAYMGTSWNLTYSEYTLVSHLYFMIYCQFSVLKVTDEVAFSIMMNHEAHFPVLLHRFRMICLLCIYIFLF